MSVDVDKIVTDALAGARLVRAQTLSVRTTLVARLQAQAAELAAEIAAQLVLNASDASDIALIDAKAAAIATATAELEP